MGWWGNFSVPFPELDFLRRWPYHHWLLRGRLSIAVLGRGLLLLEFESLSEAEQVLAKGIRRIPCIWKDGTRRWGASAREPTLMRLG